MEEASAALPDTQALLAAIVASSDDAILSTTLDGIITSWNAGAERMYGYEAQQAIGQPLALILPDDRTDEALGLLERIRRNERIEHFETVRLTRDGCRIEVLLSVSPVRDAAGQVVGVSKVARDISAQRAAERARSLAEERLRRSETLHRLLVSLHDAVSGLDDPVALQREVVQRLGRHLGASRCLYAEIDALTQQARVAWDHTDGLESLRGSRPLTALGVPLATGMPVPRRTIAIEDVETDARTADEPGLRQALAAIGTRALLLVPLVKQERLLGLLAVHQREPRSWQQDEVELAEQFAQRTWFALETARAQSALRESRNVLGLVMRSGRMGAWSRDLITGSVWWSHELEELFGLPPGGFDGTEQGFFEFVHPEDRAGVAQAVAQALSSGEDYNVTFRFRHADSGWRWMEGRGRAVYDDDGRPTALYGLGIDITQHLQAQNELRRLNKELALAARRKDEFLATLAHELRNPLAPMRYALELLARRDGGERHSAPSTFTSSSSAGANAAAEAAARWPQQVLERQIRQMTRLVDDLLEVSRITQGRLVLKREPTELGAVVQAAVEAALPLLKAGHHELALDLPEAPLRLLADPARLTQVLANLLNNAAKYTPAGGRVRLQVVCEGSATVRLSVRDSGIGIAPEHLPGVFDMFSQVQPALERTQGGLGIGLALVRALVELHGGRVQAFSDGPGQGSEFVVHLPLLPPADEAVASAPGAAPAVPARRVMVVDDNADAAQSLAMLLQLEGHEVRTAGDGRAAVQLAQAFAPDLAIVDIGLPLLNGYEVARAIRAQPGGSAPVLVALTGWGQAQDRQAALEAGFDRHLTKPVAPEQLQQVLALRRVAA